MEITIELTNMENASLSWSNPEKMIDKLPYHAKSNWGGGYFENIEKIKDFYSRFKGSEKITGLGKWEVEK